MCLQGKKFILLKLFYIFQYLIFSEYDTDNNKSPKRRSCRAGLKPSGSYVNDLPQDILEDVLDGEAPEAEMPPGWGASDDSEDDYKPSKDSQHRKRRRQSDSESSDEDNSGDDILSSPASKKHKGTVAGVATPQIAKTSATQTSETIPKSRKRKTQEELEGDQEKKPKRARIGEKSECPICGLKISKASNVRRHMEKKHHMTPSEIKKHQVKTVRTECKQCGEWLSNLSKHKQHCKGNYHHSDTDDEGQAAINQEVPEGFRRDGPLFRIEWDKFLNQQTLSGDTKATYTRKFKVLVSFFESNIQGFRMDQLLWPIELNLCFPPLSLYLDTCTEIGAKTTAIKVYKKIVQLAESIFARKYGGDSTVPMEKKSAYQINMASNKDQYVGMLADLTRAAAMQTQRNATKKQKDKENVTYNPDKLDKIMKIVCNSNTMKKILDDMVFLTPDDLMAEHTECFLRNFLCSYLMVTGNGPRPSAITGATIDEFQTRDIAENGVAIMRVEKHKTFKNHGACPIAFNVKGLEKAVNKYIKCFRYKILL